MPLTSKQYIFYLSKIYIEIFLRHFFKYGFFIFITAPKSPLFKKNLPHITHSKQQQNEHFFKSLYFQIQEKCE